MNNNQITVLNDIEHIRLHPELYIGQRHLYRLLTEVLDNSIDEILHGNRYIGIRFYRDGTVLVQDQGRGIPTDPIEVNGQKIEQPIVICTYARSSGKFFTAGKQSLVGLHGLGLTAVCALSELMILITGKRKYVFSKGTHLKTEKIKRKIKGTVIQFKPDSGIFDSIDIKQQIRDCIESILVRFLVLDLMYKNLTLEIYVQDQLVYSNKWIKTQRNRRQVALLLLSLFNRYENLSLSRIVYSCQSELDDLVEQCLEIIVGSIRGDATRLDQEYVNLYLTKVDINSVQQYLESKGLLSTDAGSVNPFNVLYVINTLPVQGGTVTSILNRLLKNLKTNKPTLSRALQDHSLIVIGRVYEIGFTSQDKQYTAKPNQQHLQTLIDDSDFKKLVKYCRSKLKELESIEINVEKDSKIVKQARRKKTVFEKLKDCQYHNNKSVLYIVEGDSAAGNLLRIRNVEYEAVLPLRGKLLSTSNKVQDIKKLTEHPVVSELLSIVDKRGRLRYGKIILVTDPDVDGLHISWLVVVLLCRVFPQIILEKRLYKLEVPLYGAKAKKNGKFIPIYDEEQLKKYPQNRYEIFRYKGLGEMDSSELASVIQNGVYYQISADDLEQIKQALLMTQQNKLSIIENG